MSRDFKAKGGTRFTEARDDGGWIISTYFPTHRCIRVQPEDLIEFCREVLFKDRFIDDVDNAHMRGNAREYLGSEGTRFHYREDGSGHISLSTSRTTRESLFWALSRKDLKEFCRDVLDMEVIGEGGNEPSSDDRLTATYRAPYRTRFTYWRSLGGSLRITADKDHKGSVSILMDDLWDFCRNVLGLVKPPTLTVEVGLEKGLAWHQEAQWEEVVPTNALKPATVIEALQQEIKDAHPRSVEGLETAISVVDELEREIEAKKKAYWDKVKASPLEFGLSMTTGGDPDEDR